MDYVKEGQKVYLLLDGILVLERVIVKAYKHKGRDIYYKLDDGEIISANDEYNIELFTSKQQLLNIVKRRCEDRIEYIEEQIKEM